MKYNLFPKAKIKNHYDRKIKGIFLIALIVLGGVLYEEQLEFSRYTFDLHSLTDKSTQVAQEIQSTQKNLERNNIFQDLRITNTYQIRDRVSLNKDRYGDLLTVVYAMVPKEVKVTTLNFDTKKGTLEMTGQAKEYPNLIQMYENFTRNGLGSNPNFSSITYDSKNTVVNFIFTCAITPQEGDKKADTASKSSSATTPASSKSNPTATAPAATTKSVSPSPSASAPTSSSTTTTNNSSGNKPVIQINK